MKKSMKGNKLLAFIIIVVLALSMCGCSGGSGSTSENVTIKTSPDKYTHYVKNYVGKNLATIGYTSWGGERFDKYGEGLLRIIPVTKSGEYIDIEDEEALQEYVVTDQSYAPNTEIKLTFDKDSDGEEYDNITAWENIDEIVLCVKKQGSVGGSMKLTEITPAKDISHRYIKDYKGQNLANVGYVSLGGEYRGKYGSSVCYDASVKFIIVTEDGSYVDIEDKGALKQYVVTGQNIEPNSELVLEIDEEYDWVDGQNVEEIELYVKKLK